MISNSYKQIYKNFEFVVDRLDYLDYIYSQQATGPPKTAKEDTMTDYLLRNIPSDLWRQVKSQAALEGISARDLILNALRERTNTKEDSMYPAIKAVIYPAHMTQETASWKYLQDAAARFANELTGKIREAYPDAELDIDIKPAGDSGPDGGAHCDDQSVQEHVDHLYNQIFDQGNFWPEVAGYCIYCDRPVYTETAPAYDDEEAWADIALEHAEDCEWVLTRAHQVET
jgi:hypothetical protein